MIDKKRIKQYNKYCSLVGTEILVREVLLNMKKYAIALEALEHKGFCTEKLKHKRKRYMGD